MQQLWIEVIYLDGIMEQIAVPFGEQIVKTPDAYVIGSVEIERHCIRRVRRYVTHIDLPAVVEPEPARDDLDVELLP